MATTQNKNNSVQEPQVITVRGASKQRFLINGDSNKVLELNTADLKIIERLQEAYPKLKLLETKIKELKNHKFLKSKDVTEEVLISEDTVNFTKTLKEYDSQMRELIDFIFNASVSEVCDGGGTMYDVIDGQLRYDCILSDILSVCEGSMDSELEKMKSKRKSYTDKYTTKKK